MEIPEALEILQTHTDKTNPKCYRPSVVEEAILKVLDYTAYLEQSLQSKVDEYSSYKSQFEEVNKKLETYSTFEEKANKYDEILPKYEQFEKEEKLRKINASAKKFKIKDEFIEFATSKVGDVEDYDSAFEEFSKNNPQYLESKEKVVETNPEMKGNNNSSDADLSKLY